MTGTQSGGVWFAVHGRATRADGSAADELVMMFAQIDDALTAFTERHWYRLCGCLARSKDHHRKPGLVHAG